MDLCLSSEPILFLIRSVKVLVLLELQLCLGIFLVLLFRVITIAERQRSAFSRCYGYGVAAVFFFHIIINVAMTVGLAPVIGIPLAIYKLRRHFVTY
jgi:hypothetical protein